MPYARRLIRSFHHLAIALATCAIAITTARADDLYLGQHAYWNSKF